MNRDTMEGKFDQLKGKAKQSIGETVGDDRMANSGTADQVKGAAKEAWGNTKDAAQTISDDAHARAEEHKHDIREKITSTAQNAKDAVSEKAEDEAYKRRRSA
ncbi:MAG TPA: CsbD family protein [Acidobacteriaceae bacterium]|nr:CsbD family protein [Acidobacteriaceae bacterium]